jgi:Zn-dependent protease with chaperone function
VSSAALGLAVLLAVHLVVAVVLSIAVAAVTPAVGPWLARLEPSRRAGRLLFLALLPSAGGVAVALGVALPAWLVHEPRGAGESAGPVLLALAVATSLLAGGRLLAAVLDGWRTARLVRRWRAEGEELEGLPLRATRVPVAAPLAALAGILRPRLLLSSPLLEALAPGELEAVVEHERAHAAARENLKRLALRASPDPLALTAAGARLRAAFEDAAEEAADRAACARVSPLRLAHALLKVAALHPPGHCIDAAVAALHRDGTIAERARALILAHDQRARPGAEPRRGPRSAAVLAALTVAAVTIPLLPRVHGLLEALVHLGLPVARP